VEDALGAASLEGDSESVDQNLPALTYPFDEILGCPGRDTFFFG